MKKRKTKSTKNEPSRNKRSKSNSQVHDDERNSLSLISNPPEETSPNPIRTVQFNSPEQKDIKEQKEETDT